MSKKIKVAGYTKKEIFDDGIEYRNFSSNLVGLQLTSEGGTPLFTMGNFSVTTNMDPKIDKGFITGKFSDFYNLDSLDLTHEEAQALLENNAGVILNLDRTNLKYYAQFGSFTEFIRVSLENIIINWPASLYVTPLGIDAYGDSKIGKTFEQYVYNDITDLSTFKVNVDFVTNGFQINYLQNGTILDSFNEGNDLRNLSVNYDSYCIFIDDIEYDVLDFEGSNHIENDYMEFTVEGNPFKGKDSKVSYHIKPKSINQEIFFNGLSDFEGYLLNRMVYPKYTATFTYLKKSESGDILEISKDLTWPVSDGYNIDFQSGSYISYVSELLKISSECDMTTSNLMNRFLVSESITSFDTVPVVFKNEEDGDSSGQKINKTLNIYGRSFDNINNFITGISFANVVTYDKKDNAPDKYLKDLAKVLGWDLVSSVLENDLLKNYVKTADSSFPGYSTGLTPVKADVELWRRLILNSPWIWKSKGTRKTIEFLLRFIGTPGGLVTFNEYVYKADKPIDVGLFLEILELNNLQTDLSSYPVDDDGYPKLLKNNDKTYFQNDGLWYRQTGGSGTTIDISTGNNPHIGPYDGGNKYLNQLKTLIPDFKPVTITGQTQISNTVKLFTNYGLGEITDYRGKIYVDATNLDGSGLNSNIRVNITIIKDMWPTIPLSMTGWPINAEDDSLSISIERTKNTRPLTCDNFSSSASADQGKGYYIFNYNQYNSDGTLNPVTDTSVFTSKECCKVLNGISAYSEFYNPLDNTIDSGYVCCVNGKCGCTIACDWTLNKDTIDLPVNSPNSHSYCEFTTLKGVGSKVVVTSDGSHCPSVWTEAVPDIVDPYTDLIGFGCKLTLKGLQEYNKLSDYFEVKSNGGLNGLSCCSFTYDVYIRNKN